MKLSSFRTGLFVLLASTALAGAQSLSDVLCSIQERRRAVEQSSQVVDDAMGNTVLDQQLIEWSFLSAEFPSPAECDALGIAQRVGLLNQAVTEFTNVSGEYLNVDPGQFRANAEIGSLRPYLPGDFPIFPRATPENYPAVLRDLALAVRKLRVIPWDGLDPTSKVAGGYADQYEELDQEENKKVVHRHDDGSETDKPWTPATLSVDTSLVEDDANSSGFIGSGISDVTFAYGQYWEDYSSDPEAEDPVAQVLRTTIYSYHFNYVESAELLGSVSGRSDQLEGDMWLLAQEQWNPATDVSNPSDADVENAAFKVVGGGSDTDIDIRPNPPSMSVTGKWVSDENDPPGGLFLGRKYFVPTGFDLMEDYLGGESWEILNQNYEDLFGAGSSGTIFTTYSRAYYAVKIPEFERGLDAASGTAEWDLVAGMSAASGADGQLVLHPRPEILFGIDLGSGFEGGNGWIGVGTGRRNSWAASPADHWEQQGWNWPLPLAVGNLSLARRFSRFDFGSMVRFVGSTVDFQVVHANDRGDRGADLPDWDFDQQQALARGWEAGKKGFFSAWDAPRMRQIAGAELLADIKINAAHEQEVTIYRMTTQARSALDRDAGALVPISGLPKIRKFTISRTQNPAEWYRDGAEDLTITEENGPTYRIQSGTLDANGTIDFTINNGTGQGSYRKQITYVTDDPNFDPPTYTVQEWIDGVSLGSLQTEGAYWNSTAHWTGATWSPQGGTPVVYTTENQPSQNWKVFQNGRYPASITATEGAIALGSATWDPEHGCLNSASRRAWSVACNYSGSVAQRSLRLSNVAAGHAWIEQMDGGRRTRTYSGPQGNSARTDAATDWHEVEYGSAGGDGFPGLPHIARGKDGTGTTFAWTIEEDGSSSCTTRTGLLGGTTVSRGTEQVVTMNAAGHASSAILRTMLGGGTLQTGGSTVPSGQFTAWGAPLQSRDYNTGLASSWTYDANRSRISSYTDMLGVTTGSMIYDALGRPTSYMWKGSAGGNVYNTNGLGIQSSLSTAGRSHTSAIGFDARGRSTGGNHSAGGRTISWTRGYGTTANSAGWSDSLSTATAAGSYSADSGALDSFTGTSLPFGGADGDPVTVEGGLLKTTTRLGALAAAYQTTWTDAWGRVRRVETPSTDGTGGDTTEYTYSTPAQTGGDGSPISRVLAVDAAGRRLIEESQPYTASGAVVRSGIDVNADGLLGAGDRYRQSVTSIANGTIQTAVTLTEDTGPREILSTTWSPSGNAASLSVNQGEETVTTTPNYGTRTVTESSTKGWTRTVTMTDLWKPDTISLSGTGVAPLSVDPVWRQDGSLSELSMTEAGAASSLAIGANGLLAGLTDPLLGNIFGGHSYDTADKKEIVTINGTTSEVKYDGTQSSVAGADVMEQARSVAVSGGGFAETIDPATGSNTVLASNAAGAKTSHDYAAGADIASTWNAGGLLKNLGRGRGGDVVFGYSQDGAKDLTSITWPSVTAGVFGTIQPVPVVLTYDSAGRIGTLSDASGARDLDYDDGRLWTTDYTAGALDDYFIERLHDVSGRLEAVVVKKGGQEIHRYTYSRNGGSTEIEGVTSGGFAAVYDRDAGRHVQGVNRGGVVQTWGRGTAGRILSAGNNVGAPTFAYGSFDAKGRREDCTTGGSSWDYDYGTAGQLVSASHPAYGTFSYGFDGIGRRTDHGNGSDALNRFLAMSHPQQKKLLIAADPDARLWVNGVEKTPFNGGWIHELDSPGSSGGWVPWSVRAVLEGAGDPGAAPDAESEVRGYAWVPPASESLTYDADGNRQGNALWDYGWDSRNRLVRAKTKNYATSPEGWDLSFDYDAEGRRFRKTVTHKTTDAQSQVTETTRNITFVWDGWDLVYERHEKPDTTVLLERKYVWGPDLGGTGGAGGLLLMREHRGQGSTDYYPLYDGSGHVTGMADAAGNLVASYVYGPFGELVSASGTMANANPWRYATKYFDEETGLCYFGQRYYDPVTGQWLSRELLGEDESLNLYSYCHNDPVNKVDVLGMAQVAINDDRSLNEFGRALVELAKLDPQAAKSLLLAAQLQAELDSRVNSRFEELAGGGGQRGRAAVMDQVANALSSARGDGGNEWLKVAIAVGIVDRDFFRGTSVREGLMAELVNAYNPLLSSYSAAVAERQAAEYAESARLTALQNSPGYKLKEIGKGVVDLPGHALAFGVSTLMATDATTGTVITFNGWNSLPGLEEVSSQERALAVALALLPATRGGGLVDDFARAGRKGVGTSGKSLNRGYITWTDQLKAGEGATNKFGDMRLSSLGTNLDRASVRYHEGVHSRLSPSRFGRAAEFRADLRIDTYYNSHLFQYVEEALAETVAQVATRDMAGIGLGKALSNGLRFPFNGAYKVRGRKLDGWFIAGEGAVVGGGILGVGYSTYSIGEYFTDDW